MAILTLSLSGAFASAACSDSTGGVAGAAGMAVVSAGATSATTGTSSAGGSTTATGGAGSTTTGAVGGMNAGGGVGSTATGGPGTGDAGTGDPGSAGAAHAGTSSAGTGGGVGGASMGGNGGTPAAGSGGTTSNGAQTWLGVWAAAPQLTETSNNPPTSLTGNTLRQLAYVSFGGSEVRLQLSNEFGDGPVTIDKAHIARSAGGSEIAPGTDTALTFDGSESVTIAQGQAVYSDAVGFEVPELTSVAITLQLGSVPSGITGHPGSRTTSYIAAGDAVSSESLGSATTTDHWYYISRFEVMAPEAAGAIVCLGDSITDGRGSTTNGNDRWPDVLARRLRAHPGTPLVSVVNVGIGGNTVVSGGLGPTATSRFDRDVLGTANVKWVLVLEGVNDIGAGSYNADVSPITDAYQTFIDKARAAGVLAYGIPILPVKGNAYEAGEPARLLINDWIRTSGAFDAWLPLDEAVASPSDPNMLREDFDHDTDNDHLHLNPAGAEALANAIDLTLFE